MKGQWEIKRQKARKTERQNCVIRKMKKTADILLLPSNNYMYQGNRPSRHEINNAERLSIFAETINPVEDKQITCWRVLNPRIGTQLSKNNESAIMRGHKQTSNEELHPIVKLQWSINIWRGVYARHKARKWTFWIMDGARLCLNNARKQLYTIQ